MITSYAFPGSEKVSKSTGWARYTKKYLKNQLVVALGGRMAEELVYGEKEVTTGASNDLQQVPRGGAVGYLEESEGGASWVVLWRCPHTRPLCPSHSCSGIPLGRSGEWAIDPWEPFGRSAKHARDRTLSKSHVSLNRKWGSDP